MAQSSGNIEACACRQGSQGQSRNQKDRPIFSQHGPGGGNAGERSVNWVARADRTQEKNVVAAHNGNNTVFTLNLIA